MDKTQFSAPSFARLVNGNHDFVAQQILINRFAIVSIIDWQMEDKESK